MLNPTTTTPLDFHLPPELEAGEPPEARGLTRDQVRLLVSDPATDHTLHARFDELPRFLAPGDVLVINTSGTRNAALSARRISGGSRPGDRRSCAGCDPVELHLSTHLPAGLWAVELRAPAPQGTQPFYDAQPGERLELPGGAEAVLLTPYRPDQRGPHAADPRRRLWIADLRLPLPVDDYLARHGFPIRYKYVRDPWPGAYYQTVYATEPGSAEMPSAGRAFTPQLITRLVAQGVQVAPLLLHTGVASLEDHEPPYEEYYRVPLATARLVNAARAAGQRVVAVGTTAVRALETVTAPNRQTHPGEGWTDLIITPQRGLFAVDALLTGFHEPKSSHLAMLAALAGLPHLRKTYAEAVSQGYLWHEFGDLHLILPCSDI